MTSNYPIMPGDRLIVSRDPAKVEAIQQAQTQDADSRLDALEAKLDLILKRLEPPAKP